MGSRVKTRQKKIEYKKHATDKIWNVLDGFNYRNATRVVGVVPHRYYLFYVFARKGDLHLKITPPSVCSFDKTSRSNRLPNLIEFRRDVNVFVFVFNFFSGIGVISDKANTLLCF